MKKIYFLLLFHIVGFVGFSQKTNTVEVDTNNMSIPYDVVKKILLDLNEYDKLKEISKLEKEEINQLNGKIFFIEKENSIWREKDSLNNMITAKVEEKVKIYEEENKNLAKENKRLKTKNTLFNIVSGLIITPLTYIAIFK